MPKHSVGHYYKDDAGSVTLTPVDYAVDYESNFLVKVAAGAVNAEYDISFDPTKIVCYLLTVETQTAAQALSGSGSEATAGTIVIKPNSTGSPPETITVAAHASHAFAPNLPGTVNEFATTAVTKLYLSNAGAADLWLLGKLGLNY